MSYFPEELDMFILPAWLKHWVVHKDCTRISVSGNVHDSAPNLRKLWCHNILKIKKGAPEKDN